MVSRRLVTRVAQVEGGSVLYGKAHLLVTNLACNGQLENVGVGGSLVINEVSKVPIVVAVRIEHEADDSVVVRVNDREDGLRVRIERELLVGITSVAVGAGAYLRMGVCGCCCE